MQILKKLMVLVVAIGLLVCVALGVWFTKLDKKVLKATENGWFPPAVAVYSKPYLLKEGDRFDAAILTERLKKSYFRLGDVESTTSPKAYNPNSQICMSLSSVIVIECWEIKLNQNQRYVLVIDIDGKIARVMGLDEYTNGPEAFEDITGRSIELPPVLFSQFYEGKPVLRDIVSMGNVPLYCVQAVTAIEDKKFLLHRGINPLGILRAVYANLRSARYSQGGSTISQQLVKNYFLSNEKTLTRKLTEIMMTLALERRATKDEILSAYFNIIYMGQNGAFQVRGFSAASDYYFAKKIENLQLHECALLAAVLNSPGRYSPFTQQENSTKRREVVLKRMRDLKYITKNEMEEALKAPLPTERRTSKKLSASYFVQHVFKELKDLNITNETGLNVYATFDESAQSYAEQAVDKTLASFKNSFDKKSNLQSIVILINHKKAELTALIGGRSFSKTQYNRALESKRQVGSVMKPLVYLSALEQDKITPLTLLEDTAFEYKYQGQVWKPRNYDNKFRGEVPAYYALKSSLNVPTARLGIDVGLDNIIKLAKTLGVKTKLKPLPSITLGAQELEPLELAKVYTAIASMGLKKEIHSISRVTDNSGKLLYEWEPIEEQVLEPSEVAVLIGMMKQTFVTGTARASRPLGYAGIAAGKTGTTSDTKDSWFVGFTPTYLAITWLGKDDATPTGLTGASGALRLWLELMKPIDNKQEDFVWPTNTIIKKLSADEVLSKLPEASEFEQQNTELIFSGYQ